MRFFPILATFPVILALGGATSASTSTVQRRQVVPIDGIAQPTAGSTISGGSSFTFEYNVVNFCETGYSPLGIYLLPGPNPPTSSSLNSTGGISAGGYLAFLGSYLDANFGTLPAL